MNDNQPHITVVGSSMVDLISYLVRMPAAGETIFGRDFHQGYGGKGANQAVMAALLGARVAMVNAVGNDTFGPATIANFESFGIDVSQMRLVDGTYSGVANVMVDPSGDNRIVLGAGANEHMDNQQVEQAFGELPRPRLVLSQLEIPQPPILRGFELGHEAGAINVLNPGPASRVDEAILRLTDWLIPNETEFDILAEETMGQVPEDREAALPEFVDNLGVSTVITLGAGGALLFEPGDSAPRHFPAPEVQAADTTGAGDAFCGAFSWALASGRSPEVAIRIANQVAGDSVQRPGTQLSYARGAGLQVLVDRGEAS